MLRRISAFRAYFPKRSQPDCSSGSFLGVSQIWDRSFKRRGRCGDGAVTSSTFTTFRSLCLWSDSSTRKPESSCIRTEWLSQRPRHDREANPAGGGRGLLQRAHPAPIRRNLSRPPRPGSHSTHISSLIGFRPERTLDDIFTDVMDDQRRLPSRSRPITRETGRVTQRWQRVRYLRRKISPCSTQAS
jgi:hypothetical protein